MIIASLVDAGWRCGADVSETVHAAIDQLQLGCSMQFTDVERGGIASVHVHVETDGRSFVPSQMHDAIEQSAAPDAAKRRAAAAVDLLVGAEARVHGVAVSDVRLHELGSADTVADALGAAVAVHGLGIDVVAAAPVPAPHGWLSSEHGPLPLPAPASLELLRGAMITGVDEAGELLTPTAAAILVAHDCAFGTLPTMTLDAVGTGAGTAERRVPNICRVFIGTPDPADVAVERVVQLDTNIDDQPPEGVAHALDRLLAAGALDAWVTPVVMKKSRPAFQLSVLVRAAAERELLDVIFRETTTLGVRRRETTRWVAEREELVVEAAGQCVAVKVARLHGDIVGIYPEFDDCVLASDASGLPVKDLYASATSAARRALGVLD